MSVSPVWRGSHTKCALVEYPQVEYFSEDAYLGAGCTILVEMLALLICNHTFYDDIILPDLALKVQHYKEMAGYTWVQCVVINAGGNKILLGKEIEEKYKKRQEQREPISEKVDEQKRNGDGEQVFSSGQMDVFTVGTE